MVTKEPNRTALSRVMSPDTKPGAELSLLKFRGISSAWAPEAATSTTLAAKPQRSMAPVVSQADKEGVLTFLGKEIGGATATVVLKGLDNTEIGKSLGAFKPSRAAAVLSFVAKLFGVRGPVTDSVAKAGIYGLAADFGSAVPSIIEDRILGRVKVTEAETPTAPAPPVAPVANDVAGAPEPPPRNNVEPIRRTAAG